MIVGQIQKGEKMGRTLNEDDVLKEIDRWIGYLDEDMITRIKIGIKKLQSVQPEQCENAEFWRKRAEYYSKMCLDLIADMNQGAKIDSIEINEEGIKFKKTQPEQRWIPCSERLPENKSYVLTTIYVPGRQPHARSGWFEDGLFMNDNGDTWKSTDREVCA